MKILFTGGGTGGHIFPIIAIAREIKIINPDAKLFFIGPGDLKLQEELSKEGIDARIIPAGKLRRYFSLNNISDILFKIPLGILKSISLLKIIRPDIIFSKGGYGSLPVVFAAKFLRLSLIVHESDATPGLSNIKAFGIAKIIITAFPLQGTNLVPDKKTVCLGNPLRKELLFGNKEEGIKLFNITQKKPILLILGGSQGAKRINDVVLLSMSKILELFEIIHQCGRDNYQEMLTQINVIFQQNPELRQYYHLYDFLDEDQMKHAYKISNLIVSRAGASTIFEILANGVPSVLIPLAESAQGHQQKNAYFLQDRGAAVVIEEQNLLPNYLIEKFKGFFSKSDILKEMSQKAFSLSIPNSSERIAKLIVDFAQKN